MLASGYYFRKCMGKGSNLSKNIYYLPGHGGQIATGLGEALTQLGWSVDGRETRDEFRKLPFGQQVDAVASDLQQKYWHPDSCVIAVSFGAYLFLHAQAQLPSFIGRVVLLSPIVGEFDSTELQMGFIPPRSLKLFELASSGQYPVPKQCEIHVGSEGWQSNPENVTQLGQLLNIPVHVVSNNGHMLDKSYVSALLDRWLPA